MKKSGVPQFGNWDNETSVPYTVYFENARRGRAKGGGVPINPNDPQENPNLVSNNKSDVDQELKKSNEELNYHNDTKRDASFDESYKKSPVNPQARVGVISPPREKKDRVEPGYGKPRMRPAAQGNVRGDRAVAVPKFGDWNDSNSNGGAGYTAIFDDLREGKKVVGQENTPQRPVGSSPYRGGPSKPISQTKVRVDALKNRFQSLFCFKPSQTR